jgi:hypothetical protein
MPQCNETPEKDEAVKLERLCEAATVGTHALDRGRLMRRDRRVFLTADAPEDIIEAVRNAKVDPRHNHLDDLLKDWTP